MNPHHPTLEYTWSAPRLRAVVIAYVVAVFVAFMAVAFFVFHSVQGVKDLFLAAVGAVAALVPGVLTRNEYRLTDAGLGKRPSRAKQPREFKEVFAWDQLSHLKPKGTGFKYYKRVQEPKPFLGLIKLHLLADRSGEFPVEAQDMDRVRAVIDRHGVPISRPPGTRRLGG